MENYFSSYLFLPILHIFYDFQPKPLELVLFFKSQIFSPLKTSEGHLKLIKSFIETHLFKALNNVP